MKKFYQSVTVSAKSTDEWIEYSGYSAEEAKKMTEYYNKFRTTKNYRTETREYKLIDEREFEELSDTEQSDVLSCYDVID